MISLQVSARDSGCSGGGRARSWGDRRSFRSCHARTTVTWDVHVGADHVFIFVVTHALHTVPDAHVPRPWRSSYDGRLELANS